MSTPASSTAASAGPLAFFTNRKIGSKIAIGFAVVLAPTAALTAMSYHSFNNVAAGFGNPTASG